jgi:ubiquinone/menaquinone biosynthesis C-methylase UbiE
MSSKAISFGAVTSATEPFDFIASSYDPIFTNSAIGMAQRAQVAGQLHRAFRPGNHILELNCGTGEDALGLGSRGVRVTAFDSSSKMIGIAKERLLSETSLKNVAFEVLRNEQLDLLDGIFDGAFSNFSGMNCLRDWTSVAAQLGRLVRPGGHFLLCIMGRHCIWEILFFLLRGNVGAAFRRKSDYVLTRIGECPMDLFYKSAREAQAAFAPHFALSAWRGIGVFVPPTYCEPFVRPRPRLLAALACLDRRLSHLPGVRSLGDHLLLDFVRSPQ